MYDVTDPLQTIGRRFAAMGLDNPFDTSQEEEQSLIRQLAGMGMSGLQYVGESLDKPGQAVRGLLAGKPSELLNLIPFSDAIGLTSSEGALGGTAFQFTDDENAVSGRDLLEKYAGLSPNEEGFDLGDVGGFAADVLLDPTTWMSGGLTQIGKAAKRAGLLPDVATQARNARLPVSGSATARHQLTPQHIFAAADDVADLADKQARFQLALGKGKQLADMPSAEELAKPIGGAFNFGVPFVDSLQATVPLPNVAKWLDEAVGGLRYGNPIGRAVNAAIDAGHTFGDPRETRYMQEVAIPQKLLREHEIERQLNPLIAQFQGKVATNLDELAKAYPDSVDPVVQAYRSTEGFGTEGFKPDPAGLQPVAREFGDKAMDFAQRAQIPVQELQDEAIQEHLARRRLEMGGEMPSEKAASLTKNRSPYRKDIKGGTGRLIELEKFMGDVRMQGPLPHDVQRPFREVELADGTIELRPQYGPKRSMKEAIKQYDANYAAKQYGEALPEFYDTLKAKQATDMLADPEFLKTAKPSQVDKLKAAVEKGTGKDRFAAFASHGATEPVERLKAGFYMDPAGAMQVVSRATADQAGRSDALMRAISNPDIQKLYNVQSPSQLMSAPDAAKVLGLDAMQFDGLPDVPVRLVEELKRKKPEPKKGGLAGFLRDAAKNVTAINKAAMTGAIFNPSFTTRNRGSGGFTNVYEGLTGPVGAVKGILHAATGGIVPWFRTEASKLARGEDITGLVKDTALQAIAARSGRTLANDREATNFVRELVASQGGGGGKHTADNLAERLVGDDVFVGGMVGPEGKEAFNWPKVASQAGETIPQLAGKLPGGRKELFVGAPGASWWNEGVVRQAPTSAVLKSGATLNDFVEAQNRIGPFLEQIRKGVDPSEAQRLVNRAQINYSPRNFTNTENEYLTTILPFYKFLKQSTKGHAAELWEKPGGGLSQLLQAGGQMNDPEEVLPEYIKENIAIPVNKIPLLNKLFGTDDPESSRYLTGLGLGFEQPLQFIHGGKRGDLPFQNAVWELLGATNPALIKLPMELMTGRSTFQQDETGTGRLTKTQDPGVGRLYNNIREMLGGEKTIDPKELPVALEGLIANSPFSRIVSAAKNITDTRERGTRKGLSNFLLGPKFTDVQESQKEGVVRELANQLIDEIPEAQMLTDFYVPKRYLPQLGEDELQKLETAKLLKRLMQRHRRDRERDQMSFDPMAELFSVGL